jgi:hypothetical protein
MRILLKIIHILENGGGGIYFNSQLRQFTTSFFKHVLGFATDPDRPDPNPHTLDANP